MSYDVAIIGGGPAGAIAAWHLAHAGRRVVLFEKASEPHHKVCGEFISGEGLPYLEEVGVNLSVASAPEITHLRLYGPHNSVEAALPQPGRGFSRLLLDRWLLARAKSAGAEIRYATARDLKGAKGEYDVLADGADARAKSVICATGKYDFSATKPRKGLDSSFVGMKLHVWLPAGMRAALRHCVELFVFPGGYGGLAPVEGDFANFCFLIKQSLVRKLGRDWKTTCEFLSQASPLLAKYLRLATPVYWPPLAVAKIPYGFLRSQAVAERVYCVGDQLAVIPSFTGDGVAIAMMSGRSAASYILAGETAGKFHKTMANLLQPQLRLGYRIHQLFKSPRLSDWSAQLANLWPGLVSLIFRKTRVAVHLPSLG